MTMQPIWYNAALRPTHDLVGSLGLSEEVRRYAKMEYNGDASYVLLELARAGRGQGPGRPLLQRGIAALRRWKTLLANLTRRAGTRGAALHPGK